MDKGWQSCNSNNYSGIDSTSIDQNRLMITRMSQELVGEYQCFLNAGQAPVNTIQLYIVGKFKLRYMCKYIIYV